MPAAVSFNCPHCGQAMNRTIPPNFHLLASPVGTEDAVVVLVCINVNCQAIIGSYAVSPRRA